MKEKKPPYVPTRMCPHRWCKPLHLAPAPFVLALLAFQLWNNLLFLVFIGSGILMSIILPKLVHYRPTPRSKAATFKEVIEDVRSAPSAIDLEMEDAKYAGTGWRMLEVRKGWARAAVTCDVLLVLIVGLPTAAIFANPHEEAQRIAAIDADMTMWVSVFIGGAFFWFSLYAHKKATQPRKPKRAWVPAFLRTNA